MILKSMVRTTYNNYLVSSLWLICPDNRGNILHSVGGLLSGPPARSRRNRWSVLSQYRRSLSFRQVFGLGPRRGLNAEAALAGTQATTAQDWSVTYSSNRYSIMTGSLTDSTFAFIGSSFGQILGTRSASVKMGVTMYKVNLWPSSDNCYTKLLIMRLGIGG